MTPNKNIKVCPDWVGAKKKGRPKKAQRQLGVADFMAKAAKKKGGKRKKSNEGDTTVMSAVEGDFDINFELEDVKVGGLKSEVKLYLEDIMKRLAGLVTGRVYIVCV